MPEREKALKQQLEEERAAREQAEQRFRDIIEYNADGIIVVDTGGSVRFVNKAAEVLFGRTKDALSGSLFGFPIAADAITEIDLVKKDGTMAVAEMHVTESQWEGVPVYLATLRDVTARKQAEKALLKNEQFLENLLDTIPIPVFYKSREGCYLGVNKTFEVFFGPKRERLAGKTVFDINPHELAEIHSSKDKELLGRGGMEVYESRVNDAKGDLRDVICHKTVFTDDTGAVEGIVGTILDITDRKLTEKALKRYAHDLDERNKELNCLYGISRLVEDPENSFEDIIQGTVELMARSWQYPEITGGRILLENREYRTENFRESPWRQAQTIHMQGRSAGFIEICYLEEKPQEAEGPFLRQERQVLDAVAERLGHILERMRARERLLQSEQKFRDLFHNANDAIFIHDMSGRFLEVNAVACRRLGYSQEELLELSPYQIDAHDYSSLVRERMQALLEQGELVFESAHRTKDGGVFPVEISSRRIEYEAKECVLSVARDVSERLEKEYEYARILNTSIDGFWVVDNRGRLLEVNPAAAEMLGYARDEMLELDLADIDADENPEALRQHLRVLREKGYERFETRHRRKSGEVIDVEISTSYIAHHKKAFVAFIRDVTQRKKAEAALGASQERLSFVIEGTQAGIWDWLVRTGETEFNERWAEMLGYSLFELSPLSMDTYRRLSHPDDLKVCEAALEKHLRGKLAYYACEGRMRHKKGHWVWVQIRGKVVERDEQGRPVRMAGTHIDISRQKALEQEQRNLAYRLQQSQKADSLARMAAAVAHHFNNQLTGVLGYLELALLNLSDSVEIKRHLLEAMEGARGAAYMSRQMLAYLGRNQTRKERLDLSEVCRRFLPEIEAGISDLLRTETDLSSPGPPVCGSEDELKQAIAVLVKNAWEASKEPAERILLCTRTVDASQIRGNKCYPVDWDPQEPFYACLEVSDRGCGIKTADMDRIFDPFFSTKFTGRGLGLALVLGMAKAGGGGVAVASEIDRGTSIRLFLPLAE
jgi:PAS domain S-box-containing protein